MPARVLDVVADENIPFAQEAFGTHGAVRQMPGRALSAADVRTADVLLVRSVTRVDAALLEGSAVRFVGSATIGTDHVDLAYLRQRGIAFAHAPGSNAESVVEYVLAALLRLAARRGEPLREKTVGAVGCGAIGARLAWRLSHFGLQVLRNDPPLAAEHPGEGFVSLGRVLAEADVVSLHVPLSHAGPHATHHLFGEHALARLRPGAWLLNTSRGPVVDNRALREALRAGQIGAAVLDVWEHEPTPDPDLLRRVDLATPHIAGYSFDGKVAGTRMLYEALCTFLDQTAAWNAEAALAPTPEDRLALTPPAPGREETEWLDALARQLYDIEADDARLRRLLELPPEEHAAYFSDLRKTYPRRRAFTRHHLPREDVPAPLRNVVEKGLGVRLTD